KLMLKLLKYEFLSKKNILLFFTLIITGVYLTLLFTTYNGKFSKEYMEYIFSICFLIFFVSSLTIFTNNIVFQQLNDFNYLGFSLPIDPRKFLYKRLIVLFLELLYFSTINILFMVILMSKFDGNFVNIFFNYLFIRKGILTIFLSNVLFLLLFVFSYTYSIISFLPSELNLLKKGLILITTLLLVFNERIGKFIQKISPHSLKLPFSFPQFNLETIYNNPNLFSSNIGSIKSEITVPSETSLLNIIFWIVLIILYFLINSYLTKEKVEIKK
ncbi:MAG: hypothetical protein ACK4SU_01595, partial [Dictyoglomus sp.]